MAKSKASDSSPEGQGGRMTKTAAVQDAIANLGKTAMPSDIQSYVAEKFGIDMSLNHVSNIKSGMKGKGRRGRRRKRRQAAEAAPAAAAPAPKARNGRSGGAIDLQDIEAAKALVQKVGPKDLHALIDLVAK